LPEVDSWFLDDVMIPAPDHDEHPTIPWWFLALLQVVAVACLVTQGPALVAACRQPEGVAPRDFAQDWCSARNWFEGEHLYAPLAETLPRYVYQPRSDEAPYLRYNGHPPGSVLLILPLGRLSYVEAHALWEGLNLAALAAGLFLIVRELRIAVPWWAVLPTLAFLVLFDPVRLQFINGNWNGILFFGVTLVWVLARKRADLAAGLALGVTASFKLYPAFLGLFFLGQRRWWSVLGCALGFGGVQLVAGLLFGWDAFADYRRIAAEELNGFRAVWTNASLPGLAAKLFAPHGAASPDQLLPLWDAPGLATALTLAALVVLTGLIGWQVTRAQTTEEQDDAFALTLSGSLLLSPLLWVDGLLLLGMPILLLWRRGQVWARWRLALAGLLWLLVAAQQWVLESLQTRPAAERLHAPWETITYLSTLCHALLLFHLLQWLVGMTPWHHVRRPHDS
jgi:hypothetical protein